MDREAELAVAVVLGEVGGLAELQLAGMVAHDDLGVEVELGDFLVGLALLESVCRLLEVSSALARRGLQVPELGLDRHLDDRAVPGGQQQDWLGDRRLR